ncbi:MAG: site-specific DNA-methyltransferase [Promethearchaeota archaeon]
MPNRLERLSRAAKFPEYSPEEIRRAKRRHAETRHYLVLGDAREVMGAVPGESVHLVVTSPPYWTLKEYEHVGGQLGDVQEYGEFLDQLDEVWDECRRVLVPGGRACLVVGDVCVSRRSRDKRHHVYPLHADVATRCRKRGLDYLAPILWYKIANASFEANARSTFLGKPNEPNGIVKNDVEYVLLFRKPGRYRSPTTDQRVLSRIPPDEYRMLFRQLWTDLPGEATRRHPAPFPVELASRLVRMFSFVGDVVLDPFVGTGTTTLAALLHGRNSIGVELVPEYFEAAVGRCRQAALKKGLEWRVSLTSCTSEEFREIHEKLAG